ncbi:MAG: acetate/propionate family kinase [Phenylobacterium sp.]|uniref:acetate/propionate family kinase n=1 Tax=Phenylobacterium sp. TaxID=1871053 RepID=UPI001A4B5E35|nr:acetate/propionate family kinase [Phenylobacterium sp.]MBL8771827.1 acetate/propionate family kinase [Phenylobacterium sp.]
MPRAVLCLNVGSSSLKFAAYDAAAAGRPRLFGGKVEGLGGALRLLAHDAAGALVEDRKTGDAGQADAALRLVFDWMASRAEPVDLVGVGHRVVHGGGRYVDPVVVDDAVLAELERFDALAPLHQPYNLAAIRAVTGLHPALPQVACFDTAFHHTIAPVAARLPLPRAWHDRGVRRYGFHGLSYAYLARTLAGGTHGAVGRRVLAAHLGSGASLCAMVDGASLDTTMGFTALDGLMMGTRPGSLDPGVVLYLQAAGMAPAELEDLLYRRSGLLGVSGISADMRVLEASAAPEAREAIDLFVWRTVREAGGLVAAMGGLDTLVFTAGIGENSPGVRAAICERLAYAGVRLDPLANREQRESLHADDSRVKILRIPTDEERMIADETLARLAPEGAGEGA